MRTLKALSLFLGLLLLQAHPALAVLTDQVLSCRIQLSTTGLGVGATPSVVATADNGVTWTYRVAPLLGGIVGKAGSASTLGAHGPTTLDATHTNTVTWTLTAGATGYAIYRTAAGGTPNTTGIVATINDPNTLTLVDNGMTGDGSAANTSTDPTALAVGDHVLYFTDPQHVPALDSAPSNPMSYNNLLVSTEAGDGTIGVQFGPNATTGNSYQMKGGDALSILINPVRVMHFNLPASTTVHLNLLCALGRG